MTQDLTERKMSQYNAADQVGSLNACWRLGEMRDNYVADIGDFGKYILLDELIGQSNRIAKLGINWYYTDHMESPNGDGGHIAYLDASITDNSRYRSCSPELYDKLAMIIREGKRTVAEIESGNVLPRGTIFYSAPIPYSGNDPSDRIRLRRIWFQQSLNILEDADILFLDPDNGISLDDSIKGKPLGMKYVFLDEIKKYYGCGKSLIVYNHRDRRPRHEYEMKILNNREFVSSHNDIKVLRFRRVSVRDYIFIIQKRHRQLMQNTLNRLTSPPLDFLFQPYHVMEKKTMIQTRGNWTNPSVVALAAGSDPIEIIIKKARSVVLNALQEGWDGPPFDPLRLAEYLKVKTVPSAEVFDARTVSIGSSRVQIEYNPNKPSHRTRFTLAHELAHTLFPDCGEAIRKRLSSVDMRDDDWQLELLCNIAAAEFLMPAGTGKKIEQEAITIDNIFRLQKQYEVSTEAISLRMAHLTSDPCTIFVAAPSSDKPHSAYRIDYSVPSRTSDLKFPRGLRVRNTEVLSQCSAIGYTAKGEERWGSLPKINIECIGIPPYPGARRPRIVGVARKESSKATNELRIKYLRGDALEPRGKGSKIIAHIVNDKTPNWGAGFPLSVGKKWPFVQKDFRESVLSDRTKLSIGNIHICHVNDQVTLVHMIAQHGYGPSRKPRVRYAALRLCLDQLASIALKQSATVHMPLIGTGQAGGEWEIIADLIDDSLVRQAIGVTVYILPGAAIKDFDRHSSDLFN